MIVHPGVEKSWSHSQKTLLPGSSLVKMNPRLKMGRKVYLVWLKLCQKELFSKFNLEHFQGWHMWINFPISLGER